MDTIMQVTANKKQYLDLLLLADEQESMIDRYLDRGTMYVLGQHSAKAVCVVTDEGEGILELKNLAVMPVFQHMGYGRQMIAFLEQTYRPAYRLLRVGTGDSPLTLPFYKRCGFHEVFRVRDFFMEHYDHPIWENGKQLRDMIYLEKQL